MNETCKYLHQHVASGRYWCGRPHWTDSKDTPWAMCQGVACPTKWEMHGESVVGMLRRLGL